MRFPTIWYVRPGMAQTSLRIQQTDQSLCWSLKYSMTVKLLTEPKLKRRLHRLVWIYTCQNTTLLEIMCLGSIFLWEVEKDVGKYEIPQNLSSSSHHDYQTDYYLFLQLKVNTFGTKSQNWQNFEQVGDYTLALIHIPSICRNVNKTIFFYLNQSYTLCIVKNKTN